MPGTNQVGSGGPVQASLGPLRAMHQSFLDRWHDGTTGVRMERWNPDGALGERDGTMALLLAPGSPDRPSGCRSGPLGQPSGVGQPTRSLGRLAGPQNRILTRNTRPANSSPRLISQAVLAARRLPTRRRGPHESFKDAPEAPVRCRAPPRGVGSPLPLPEMGSRVRRGDGIAG